jgi:hypothetical protein
MHQLLPVTSIQRFIAGFLLVVFAFGISPKRSWHNLVANHKDGKPGAVAHNHQGSGVSKAAFNCQCDNLISESPFVATTVLPQTSSLTHHEPFFAGKPVVPYTAAHFSFSLRGPPVC